MSRKSKVEFVATPQQRQEAARFVIYELWMLRECAAIPDPRSQAEKNVWYEGLVLHARVLRDFFFTKSNDGKRVTHDMDIVAADFFNDPTTWPYTSEVLPPYLSTHKERMDGALAHLSFRRLDYTGNEKSWDPQCILSEIGDVWLEFIKQLQGRNEPAAAWFLALARRLKLPVAPPF